MNRLTDLPNIGPKLAEHLEKAGIPSPEALREAVEGVRKSLLPPDRKAELKAWFRSLRS